MNIEAYDLDSLRLLVRKLEKENKLLKQKLMSFHVPFEEENIFEEVVEKKEEFELDQGDRIKQYTNIPLEIARSFFSIFWGREDVYAKRSKNGGYYPQCENRWNASLCPIQRGEKSQRCENCENKKWKRLTLDTITKHLLGKKEDGSDVIGIYPLFSDGTCRLIVFDFDNHERGNQQDDYANNDSLWQQEVDALRKICCLNGINALVERSRSAKGAHVWIFFDKPISASKARNFGFLLLEKGLSLINLRSFYYYDRMYPSQANSDGIGNLIALPLQGRALENGNSAFVDENWNAYNDQWEVLNNISKLSIEEVDVFISKWQQELAEESGQLFNLDVNRIRPWKRKQQFYKSDVVGKLHIVLCDGVYVDTLNIKPRLQNQIRSLAAFDNPEYYKNKRLGYSNYYNFSVIYLGKDIDGYIKLPRGFREQLIEECKKALIDVDIVDEREKGKLIRVKFKGDLRVGQDIATERLLTYTDGILSAATAFGKTAVCSYLIAERKVSTLILLQSIDLQNQWVDELKKFLLIDENPPTYKTKSGKEKKRESVIGILNGNKNSLTGIIDVATVGALKSLKDFEQMVDSYGMVIVDECHHAAADTYKEILQKVKSRYVYGVSATPIRADNLDRVIFMMLGPIRHRYTALDRVKDQGIAHYFIPRYTRVVDTTDSKDNINKAYDLISNSLDRNEMIARDVIASVENNQSPLVLTRYKQQAKWLFDRLKDSAENVFLLYGDNTDKENENIRLKLKQIDRNESMILIATGQKIGEGFDCPRLDVLMLASPVSFEGKLQQYLGRLNRDYEGKLAVYVYDYIDAHMKVFDNMYSKRLKTYKKSGFSILVEETKEKQIVNAIYDSLDYSDKFEKDLIEADKSIVISSPNLSLNKVERFIEIIRSRQEKGVKVTVLTTYPSSSLYGDTNFLSTILDKMRQSGIYVYTKEEVDERFAVIDDQLVWHGSVNLLGKEDIWDNLMRIHHYQVASELLEIAFGNSKRGKENVD